MSALCIKSGSDNLANSIESLVALYCLRNAAKVQLQTRAWDPRKGNLADDIDNALINATKSYKFPEKLWLNLKVIVIERLLMKV